MTKLLLGVVDIPYDSAHGTSTGDVAGDLENKYHIMEFFFERHKQEIASQLADAASDALDAILMGAPPPPRPLQGASEEIQKMFRDFLDAREMDGLVDGVPTKAALDGVSHRFKDVENRKKSRGPRPSFIDTGLYQASFRAEIDS